MPFCDPRWACIPCVQKGCSYFVLPTNPRRGGNALCTISGTIRNPIFQVDPPNWEHCVNSTSTTTTEKPTTISTTTTGTTTTTMAPEIADAVANTWLIVGILSIVIILIAGIFAWRRFRKPSTRNVNEESGTSGGNVHALAENLELRSFFTTESYL